MYNNYLIKIVLFIVIFLILFLINNYAFPKKNEKFGVYCGSYNNGPNGPDEDDCKGNSSCQWNSYTSRTGVVAGWCGLKTKK